MLEDNLAQEVEDVNLQINKEIKSENYSFEVKITKITFLRESETSYNLYVYFYELSSALDADNFQILLTRDGREYNLFQQDKIVIQSTSITAITSMEYKFV